MGCGIGVKRHRDDCIFDRSFHVTLKLGKSLGAATAQTSSIGINDRHAASTWFGAHEQGGIILHCVPEQRLISVRPPDGEGVLVSP
jgi:hypothetical protein